MRRASLAGIVAAALVAAACSVLTSFDDFEGAPVVTEGGTPEAAPDAGCALDRWPDPPPVTSDGPDIGDLISAVDTMRVTEQVGSDAASVGYDLDGLCTCPERAACLGAKANAPCDTTEGGLDNASAALFSVLVEQGVGIDDSGLRAGLAQGRFGIVLRLSGYSGGPDDPRVALTVFNAVAVNADPDGGVDAGGLARFDGSDRWVIDSESLLDNRFPAHFSRDAYVRDGVLVADLASLTVRMRIPTGPTSWGLVVLEAFDVHLTARLGARTPQGVTMTDGRIVGRLPLPSLLRQMQRSGACKGTPIYATLKPYVCGARDVPLEPGSDGLDRDCDALSMGFGFTAIPATTASSTASRSDKSPCTIEEDTCP